MLTFETVANFLKHGFLLFQRRFMLIKFLLLALDLLSVVFDRPKCRLLRAFVLLGEHVHHGSTNAIS